MTPSRFGRTTRRQFVASSAIGGAAALTAGHLLPARNHASSLAALAQDSSSDVPMFRGNAARTGEMPGPGPDDAKGIEALWTFVADDYITHSPSVVGRVVYIGSNDNNLYAVNAEDGAERWRFTTGDAIGSSPAVANGMVYVGSSDNNLYALNAEDGMERWRFATTSSIFSSPAVIAGFVYIGNSDGNLYAVGAEDGVERWRFTTGDRIDSSPAVMAGVVYVGCVDGNVYAIGAEDGVERWRFETGDRIRSSPALAEGTIYAGSDDGNVYAIGAEDGTERWRFTTDDGSPSSPVVADGVVYVAGYDGYLNAFGSRAPRLSAGGTARVTEPISLRGGPAPTAVERVALEPDAVVTITGEAETTGGVIWWPVTVDATGDQGWVEASKLEPLTSGPEATAAV